jgi:hypothetical protein
MAWTGCMRMRVYASRPRLRAAGMGGWLGQRAGERTGLDRNRPDSASTGPESALSEPELDRNRPDSAPIEPEWGANRHEPVRSAANAHEALRTQTNSNECKRGRFDITAAFPPSSAVTLGLVPRVHPNPPRIGTRRWILGTSPRMTRRGIRCRTKDSDCYRLPACFTASSSQSRKARSAGSLRRASG